MLSIQVPQSGAVFRLKLVELSVRKTGKRRPAAFEISNSQVSIFYQKKINQASGMSPCERLPCLNNGVCVPDNVADSRTCTCTSGFTGDNCESKFYLTHGDPESGEANIFQKLPRRKIIEKY